MKLSFQPLVIGSHALVHHLDALHLDHNLEPLDHDIIVPNQKSAYEFIDYLRQFNSSLAIEKITTSKKFKSSTIVLNHYGSMWELSFPTSKKSTTYQLYHGFEHEVQLTPKLPESINYANYMYASLDLLYTLKMSHRYLRNSPHFHKTMKHIKNMRKLGAKIIDEQFYQARMKETYDYATPKLNVGKSDFFHSNFNYIYDHDSIHRAVKLLDKPAYEYYMTENQEVHCDKDRFFAQSKAIQLLGVLEESYVLALERSQIPNEFMVRPYESFMMALEKVCTSITSGWFREFAWENFDVVTNLYNDDYITKFTNAMKDGIILPYKPTDEID